MHLLEEGISEALKPFRCVRLRVMVRAVHSIQLPSYLGSTLRGAFGVALHQSCCALRRQECSTCLLRTRCIYSYTFETSANGGGSRERRYASAPHPFVLNLDTSPTGEQEPGSLFSFGMTLIGRAVDFLPYFIHAFQRMGQLGIGRGRGTFEIESVSALDGGEHQAEAIFQNGELRLPDTLLGLCDALQSVENPEEGPLQLRLLTPLRLVEDGELRRELSFSSLMRNLLRRLENLVLFHCDGSVEFPYGDLLEQAESVRTSSHATRWYDWERYSSRQNRRMKLGGLVGDVVFEGDWRPFLPVLALGEWVNAGKGTSFGLGRYRIVKSNTAFPAG